MTYLFPFNIQNQSIRKRRKKRRASTTSSPEHTPEYYNTTSIQIKQEKETDGSAIENNDDHSENSSDVPMNLSNTEQSRRIKNEQTTSTNILQQGTSSQFLDNDTIKNKLKNKLMPIVEANDQKPEENQYNIFCKKVRQAQQMKMSAAANVTNPVSSTITSNLFVNPNDHPGSMHAPYTHNTTTLNNQQNLEHPNESMLLKPTSSKRKQKRETIQMMKRKLEESAAANDSPLNSVDSNELPLKEDFILPRERFISICNMDRNALDTYLNNSEENSQDLELLQYFGEDKNHNKNTDCIEEDLGPMTTSVPLLENYQLNFNENNNNNNKCDRQNAEKIMQLRTILEEKYNTSCNATNAASSGNDSVIKNLLLKNSHIQHHNHQQQQQNMNNDATDLYQASGMTGDHLHAGNFQMNSILPNTGIPEKLVVPQSPNTRRKNFSFVPIPSQSSRVKNINLNPAFRNNGNINNNQPTSPFISPRVTPVSSKQPNNQQSLSVRSPNVSIDTSKNIPLLGVNNTAFCRPTHFKMEPSSAPPSPSMAPQNHFNFSPHSQQQHQQQHQHQFQFNNQNIAPQQQQGSTTNYNYPVESRSQSVPPHCTNNIYGGNNNAAFNNYSSACSSMAATPVPPDYQEFNDTNILEIFNNEQPPLSSTIKMETNDDVISDLLDNDLLNQNSNHSESDSLLSGTMRPRFNSISRSVPCTPLPYHSNNSYTNVNGNSMNASVPNTPISNASNPFRYSPELQRTRDFLINGFNNNINHNNNNIINKLSKAHDGTATIDELDTNLLNNL